MKFSSILFSLGGLLFVVWLILRYNNIYMPVYVVQFILALLFLLSPFGLEKDKDFNLKRSHKIYLYVMSAAFFTLAALNLFF